ncbi:MAG: hypothetical protein CO090_00865 [Acidobacteria bacterium CG_4_9_14_3_um_filter_49_7]|nr:MAG: hypothetical protein CO090_00865 [Acidobacteria bacterium CG_4_9_14_3_um_filter_49_7]
MKDALTEYEFSFQELEFNRVLETLSGYCGSEQGVSSIKNLAVFDSPTRIEELQKEYREIETLLDKGRKIEPAGGRMFPLPVSYVSDYFFEPLVLLGILRNYEIGISLKKFARENKLLAHHFLEFIEMEEWAQAVRKAFDPDGSIREDATPHLKKLHARRRRVEKAVESALRAIMGSHHEIMMDELVTRRAGRFVIPVKRDFIGRIQGLVHDTSASGATAFFEPISVVQRNNELQQCQNDIQIEENRLLKDLSRAVLESQKFFGLLDYTIGFFDSMLARYRFSTKYECTLPELSPSGPLRLKEARHPVLLFNRQEVISNLIEVDREAGILVVTGSNTGGKTVFLKMCGLLQLMNQAVIPVPVAEGSIFPVFSSIITDIGDRQSIDESLSTFSSHMLGLKRILEKVGPDTLVLIDELGTGTAPTEGAAIAVAVAGVLADHGGYTVITTHYQEVTQMAFEGKNRVRLASVEFDEKNLVPTFRLLYDLPGRSHAISIARRIGLPEAVLERAQDIAGESTDGNADAMVVTLARKLRNMEEEQTRLDMILKENEALAEQQKALLKDLKAEKKELYHEFEQKFEHILGDFRKEKERALYRVSEKRRTAAKKVEEELISAYEETIASNLKDTEENDSRGLFSRGDKVRHHLLGVTGIVDEISKQGDRARVTVRGKSVWFASGDLSIEETGGKGAGRSETNVHFSASQTVRPSLQCNLVGKTVEDGIYVLEHTLDQCVLQGHESIRVIHGHGSGKLRKGIRTYLEKSPYVERFEPDTDDGATLVFLK